MFNKDAKSPPVSTTFSIFQTDAGTSPTADSASDTITFTSSDASVLITGNSTTDTIDFSVTAAGAGDTEPYVTIGNTAGLSAERALTGTANQVIITDNGANSTVVLSLPQSIATTSSPTFAGLTLTGFSGVLKATAGVISGSATTTDLTEGANLYFTDERAQDAVGTILTDTSTIDLTYTDATPSITADIVAGSITNTHVNASAAIARSKLASGTANHVVINDSGGAFSSEANLDVTRGGTGLGTLTANNLIVGAGTSDVTFIAPGTSGNVLTSNGTTWVSQAPSAGSGDVVGPGSATDNAVARFDGTTGKLIQNSVVIVSDTGAVTGVTDLAISGSTASNFINASGTLNNATGDEIAYVLDFTVNKATSGTTTGLKLNMTDTSSPGTAYLMDLQKGGGFKFRVDENGNTEIGNITGTAGSGIRIDGGTASGADLKLRSTSHATPGNVQIEDNILFDGTLFKTTASSFTIRDVINRDILVVNATDMFINDVPVTIERDVTITDTITITPPASSGSVTPAMTLTAAAHTGLTAATEFHDLLIDLSRTVQWTAGANLTNQRALYITTPIYTATGLTTFDEVSSVCIQGPPTVAGGSALQVTTAIGFKMEQVSIPAAVSTGIGFVIYSPTTGGASTVSTGSFMDGNLGVNTLTPGTWLDVKIPNLSSSGNDIVCIDGTTRYAGMYVGGTSITVAPGSGTSGFLLDFGWTPSANSAFGVAANQTFFSAEGSVNMSGGVSCGIFTFRENGSGGTATNSRALVATYTTASGSTRAVTTGRSLLTTGTINGTGTVTTYAAIDQTFSTANVAVTVTTGHYLRLGNPSRGAASTITNWDSILLEDNTATIGTRKNHIRALGTTQSCHVGSIVIGADATAAHRLEVKDGNIGITNTGTEGELRFYEPSASGSNYSAFKAQAQAGDVTYTLPAADGSSGDFLSTNGSGTLSWASAAGGSPHALLSATHSDTVASAVSRGSLIYGNSTPAWAELNIGASGTVLKSDGTDVSWGTVAVPVTYMKTSGTTKDNNTMADDSVMSGMTLATNKYTFIGFFWVSAGSTTPDFKFQLTVNTSTVNDIKYFWHATIASGAVQEGFVTASATSSGIINVAASGQTYVRVTGSLDVTNAGTLDVEWAQNTTDAVNLVTMNRGSFFQLTVV